MQYVVALGACVNRCTRLQTALLERWLRLIEPAGAQLAAAAGLPELSRLHVETRQPAVAVDPCVDADRMAPVAWQPTGLLRVPAHHHLPRTVRARPEDRLPVQQVQRLLVERQVRIDVRVDEEVRVDLVPVKEQLL